MFRIHSIFIVVLLATACAGPDLTGSDPALAQLTRPYTSIESRYYLDGGSIEVIIVDANGRSETFFIPARLGEPAPYSKVLVGGNRESQRPAATKRALGEIIAAKRNLNADDELCVMVLLGKE